ncbi:MAG TPA: hypothetical protein PLV70_06620 [Flavobacteriales bacterium]|nr:hypothetical protein [Flavobacteriales bacterium]HRN37997.1 hypothetical protein [Flavobacteriales bacterium]HRO40953.1 hypothetical protein [Flavobacteriales bacterium]HRP81553.1 hypothetical protein [Flavobacteriales bacterium]HRQ84770.1 hypothetical protein [Flavobacteriales bacterium]
MEVKLEIPFEQLLRMLRQLTPAQREVARSVLKPVKESKGARIMALAGAFADMDEHEYADLAQYLKDTRTGLFDRTMAGR